MAHRRTSSASPLAGEPIPRIRRDDRLAPALSPDVRRPRLQASGSSAWSRPPKTASKPPGLTPLTSRGSSRIRLTPVSSRPSANRSASRSRRSSSTSHRPATPRPPVCPSLSTAARETGQFERGQLIMLLAFGAGLTWACYRSCGYTTESRDRSKSRPQLRLKKCPPPVHVGEGQE